MPKLLSVVPLNLDIPISCNKNIQYDSGPFTIPFRLRDRLVVPKQRHIPFVLHVHIMTSLCGRTCTMRMLNF